ncbi:MAG: iaaA [Phycisphaerales bacterium]|nr:iaaA [Phycisphaerales bacterium]
MTPPRITGVSPVPVAPEVHVNHGARQSPRITHGRDARDTSARILCLLVFCLVSSSFVSADEAPAKENQSLPLLFHEDFKSPDGALKRFTFTDKDAWKIIQDDVNGTKQNVLSLVKQSAYKPPVRSPLNIAWINDLKVSHFILEAKCRITTELIPHRDLCFFLAGVDASHMIYCHVSQQEDKIHNQIHLVNGKDREPITVKHAKGTPWDGKYHTVKIARNDAGVSVYFDGTLLMSTDRQELPEGKLGVGSFDDLGNFAEITVWGKKAD